MDLGGGRARKRHRVDELPIPKGLWSCARDVFWSRILTDDPYPDDVDEFAKRCFMTAAEEFDPGLGLTESQVEEVIHTVRMGPLYI